METEKRIVPVFVGLISSDHGIYLMEQAKSVVIERVKSCLKEDIVEQRDFISPLFKIRIEKSPERTVWIKVGDTEYRILNLDLSTSDWSNLLLYNTIDSSGESDITISEPIEITFSDGTTQVSLISTTWPGYNKIYSEMERKFNCENMKKTRKFIPGHRYDTQKDTLYFLGTYMSHRKKFDDSFYVESFEGEEVMLFAKEIEKSDKTIQDVLQRGSISYGEKSNIIAVTKMPSRVDCGLKLKDTGEPLWSIVNEVIFHEAKNSSVTKYSEHSNLTYSNDFHTRIQTVLDLVTDFSVLNQESLDLIKVFTKGYFQFLLVSYWGIDKIRPDLSVRVGNTEEENSSHLVNLLISNIEDINSLKRTWTISLYEKIGVSLTDLASESIKEFVEETLPTIGTSFVDLLIFERWWLCRDPRSFEVVRDLRNYSDPKKEIESWSTNNQRFPKQLTGGIIKLLKFASSTSGVGVDSLDIMSGQNKILLVSFTADQVVDQADELDKEAIKSFCLEQKLFLFKVYINKNNLDNF